MAAWLPGRGRDGPRSSSGGLPREKGRGRRFLTPSAGDGGEGAGKCPPTHIHTAPPLCRPRPLCGGFLLLKGCPQGGNKVYFVCVFIR